MILKNLLIILGFSMAAFWSILFFLPLYFLHQVVMAADELLDGIS